MFRVFFVNHNYFSPTLATTVEQAIEISRKAGFETTVYNDYNEIVASFSPLYGVRKYQVN